MKIAGIRRGSQYSPNHIGNDAAIFDLTVKYLKAKSCEIIEYSEAEFWNAQLDVDAIFNMVRDWRSIKKLQELENDGIKVINSAYGIENCTREKMTRLLVSQQVPHPQSVILSTKGADISELEALNTSKFWIKRGDFHAIHREDVTFVGSLDEAESILNEYALRGIPSAVVNAHLPGDLVKFYGVAGTDFFYWFYPNVASHSKFGLERINGESQGLPFDPSCLKEICTKASKVLNVDIYGGDCVISEDGTIRIIDFNDWPSFAPCRQDAAPYIADAIYENVQQYKQVKAKQYSFHNL